MNRSLLVTGLAVALGALGSAAHAGNLLVNGGFESGDFTGWSVNNTGCCGNDFYVVTNGSNAPVSGFALDANPTGEGFFAVSDQDGAGGEVLTQAFTASGSSATVKFDWFDNSYATQFGDDLTGATQTGSVDILTGTADPYSTAPSDVVANLLLNPTGTGGPNPWTTSTFTVGGLTAGQTYQIRFGTGQCCFFQELGVDNVSVSGVPEPASWTMMLTGVFGVAGALRLTRRRQALVA